MDTRNPHSKESVAITQRCSVFIAALALPFALTIVAGSRLSLADEGDGWLELFNGQDLKGWRFQEPVQNSRWTVGTAALDPQDARKLVVTPGGNEMINPVEPVKVISAQGRGVDIYSEAKFGDAVIELEVMVAKGANSGIYLMGEYEIQMLDYHGEIVVRSRRHVEDYIAAEIPDTPLPVEAQYRKRSLLGVQTFGAALLEIANSQPKV